jgi:hypothetical protein
MGKAQKITLDDGTITTILRLLNNPKTTASKYEILRNLRLGERNLIKIITRKATRKSSNYKYTLDNGELMTAQEITDISSVSVTTTRGRLAKGWRNLNLLTQSIKEVKALKADKVWGIKYLLDDGRKMNVVEISNLDECLTSRQTIDARLKAGIRNIVLLTHFKGRKALYTKTDSQKHSDRKMADGDFLKAFNKGFGVSNAEACKKGDL